jgi:uncharacterized sulfatase
VYAPGKSGIHDASSDSYVEQYLYDLQGDPHELHNLISDPDYLEIRETLAEILKQRMAAIGEDVPEIRAAS